MTNFKNLHASLEKFFYKKSRNSESCFGKQLFNIKTFAGIIILIAICFNLTAAAFAQGNVIASANGGISDVPAGPAPAATTTTKQPPANNNNSTQINNNSTSLSASAVTSPALLSNDNAASLASQLAEQSNANSFSWLTTLLNWGGGSSDTDSYQGLQYFYSNTLQDFFTNLGDLVTQYLKQFIAWMVQPLVETLTNAMVGYAYNPDVSVGKDPFSVGAQNIFHWVRDLSNDLLLLFFILSIWRYWTNAAWAGGSLMGAVARIIVAASATLAWPTIYHYVILISNSLVEYLMNQNPMQPSVISNAVGTAIANILTLQGSFNFFDGLMSSGHPVQAFVLTGPAIVCELLLVVTIGLALIASFIVFFSMKVLQIVLVVAAYVFAPFFLLFLVSSDTDNYASSFIRSFIETSLWTFVWSIYLMLFIYLLGTDVSSVDPAGHITVSQNPQNPWFVLFLELGVLQAMVQTPGYLSRGKISEAGEMLEMYGLYKMGKGIGNFAFGPEGKISKLARYAKRNSPFRKDNASSNIGGADALPTATAQNNQLKSWNQRGAAAAMGMGGAAGVPGGAVGARLAAARAALGGAAGGPGSPGGAAGARLAAAQAATKGAGAPGGPVASRLTAAQSAATGAGVAGPGGAVGARLAAAQAAATGAGMPGNAVGAHVVRARAAALAAGAGGAPGFAPGIARNAVLRGGGLSGSVAAHLVRARAAATSAAGNAPGVPRGRNTNEMPEAESVIELTAMGAPGVMGNTPMAGASGFMDATAAGSSYGYMDDMGAGGGYPGDILMESGPGPVIGAVSRATRAALGQFSGSLGGSYQGGGNMLRGRAPSVVQKSATMAAPGTNPWLDARNRKNGPVDYLAAYNLKQVRSGNVNLEENKNGNTNAIDFDDAGKIQKLKHRPGASATEMGMLTTVAALATLPYSDDKGHMDARAVTATNNSVKNANKWDPPLGRKFALFLSGGKAPEYYRNLEKDRLEREKTKARISGSLAYVQGEKGNAYTKFLEWKLGGPMDANNIGLINYASENTDATLSGFNLNWEQGINRVGRMGLDINPMTMAIASHDAITAMKPSEQPQAIPAVMQLANSYLDSIGLTHGSRNYSTPAHFAAIDGVMRTLTPQHMRAARAIADVSGIQNVTPNFVNQVMSVHRNSRIGEASHAYEKAVIAALQGQHRVYQGRLS